MQQHSNSAVDDFLNGGGGRSAFPGDSQINDEVEGDILSLDIVDQTDMNTGEVKTFADGTPMKQLVVTLQTSTSVDENDDGVRKFYAKALGKNVQIIEGTGFDGKEAIRRAVQKAGAPLAVGGHFYAKQTGLAANAKVRGGKPSKLFGVRYTQPAPKAIAAEDFDSF